MEYKKIGFVGLGLIGGSIAKAVRRYYPDCEIAAFDKNRETLALAVQEGTIHTACSSIDENFRGCSYIFLCTPVAYNAAYLAQLKDLAGKDCILTDVGSVKPSMRRLSPLIWKRTLSADIPWPVLRKAASAMQRRI